MTVLILLKILYWLAKNYSRRWMTTYVQSRRGLCLFGTSFSKLATCEVSGFKYMWNINSRSNDDFKRMSHLGCCRELLFQIHIFGFHTIGKREVTCLEELSQCELKEYHRQIHTWTHPSAGSKWPKLKVLTLVIKRAVDKSIWVELEGLWPQFWISVNGINIHNHSGVLGDIITT